MQRVSSWVTEDRKTLLNFSETTINTFLMHMQIEQSDCEAGGVLLGSVHGTHMLIEHATVPTAWDKKFRYLFERMPFGHEVIALARWTASQGTIRYLGACHTHPEDHPTSSGLDRSEWNHLSSRRRDNRSIVAVIVGRKRLYVELVPGSGQGPVLLSVE